MYLRTYLVEDNPTIRENLVATLKELAQVETVGMADTELEAESWLTANPDAWDLVIIDLFLRQGSGMGVLEACAPLAGHLAIRVMNFLTRGAPATQEPVMMISAICMEKARRLQNP